MSSRQQSLILAAVHPDGPEEWALEQAVFDAAGVVPEVLRSSEQQLLCDLWFAFVMRGKYLLTPESVPAIMDT